MDSSLARLNRLRAVTFRQGRAVGLVVALLAFAPGPGFAQSLTDGAVSSPIDPNGAGLDADTGLRGPIPDTSKAAAPVGAVDPTAPASPEESETSGAPRRRTIAGQGSALLPSRVGPPRLPVLQPYPTAGRLPRAAAIDTIDPTTDGANALTPVPVAGPTVAALPLIAAPRRRTLDPAPFAPLGYTVGTLRLTPYIEESLGYDSNPDQTSLGVKPSGFSRTEGGFALLSQWSSNELRSVMHAGYDEFFSDPQANRPDAAGTVDYRYDVSRALTIDSEGRFGVSTQRPGSPELSVAVAGRPLIASYGATLGADETLGRLTLGVHGLFDRTTYDNGRFSDGSTVALDTENFNDYGLALRADYQLTPTLRPFGEVTLDSRVHDFRLDLSGYDRDSDGILGRLGSTFELTPLITGTVSAGYEDRRYTDKRLRDLRGPVVDANVVYAVTPLTTVTLLASTSFDETTLAGSAGAESRSVSLQVSHALLRNLTLSALLGYLNTDYIDSPIVENTYSATLKADYFISRSLVLEASYNHETLHSTDPGSSFTQDVFLMGLRLQH